MSEPLQQQLIELTQQLLDSIARGDWKSYEKFCDPTLTCFEPEARGQLVSGMQFHKYYFDNLSYSTPVNTTMASPHVRLLGPDVAVVSYVRLQQTLSPDGSASTSRHEETRIWRRQADRWIHVHFHRSAIEMK